MEKQATIDRAMLERFARALHQAKQEDRFPPDLLKRLHGARRELRALERSEHQLRIIGLAPPRHLLAET